MRTTIVNTKSCERDRQHELADAELANVGGGKGSSAHAGKATFQPLLITKHYDKASPVLL